MRLIVAIDGSDSDAVLEHAASVAEAFGADLDAVHIGHEHDERATRTAGDHGVPLRLLDGPVAPMLRRLAADEDVLGTVIGTGAPTPDGLPAGSLATDLMAQLPGVLVMVPADGRRARPIRRVLVALDGSPETAAALDQVIHTVRSGAVEMVVLHVIDPASVPPYADQPHHWSAAFAKEFHARHAPSEDVVVELRCGDPAARVLDTAEQTDADLVALAWHQRLQTGRAEVVRRAVAEGRLPVLLIPVDPP